MARGQPKRPAPVSGPSALSRRTDGGAGNAKQPIRTPTGGDYGSAQALEDQQKAAPLAVAGGGGGAVVSPSGGTAPIPQGVFGPTERPSESALAGLQNQGQFLAENVDEFIRMLYVQFPHPALSMLLRKDF